MVTVTTATSSGPAVATKPATATRSGSGSSSSGKLDSTLSRYDMDSVCSDIREKEIPITWQKEGGR